VTNREEITKLVQETMLTKSTPEWERRFAEHAALFAPILPVSEVLRHPQVEALPASVLVDHPVHGSIPVPAPAITMHDTPGEVTRPPPVLGQHTYEVLSEAGYDRQVIDDLVAAGVLVAHPLGDEPQSQKSNET
jgi:crotonobetainyl-CoA:carnitine CoA-transferase CaiB-like acyl-CoA transferase